MITWFKNELKDYKKLLRAIPSLTITLFILSVVCMNLLANKELFNYKYLALDCGFTLSWISFLCMDIICKRFGAKAATKVSVLAIGVNLVTTLIFKLLTLTPGNWGEFYTFANFETNNFELANVANQALNTTFGGAWYVVIGSAIAMFGSSVVNSVLNCTIGKKIKDDGSYKKFAIRSFISTGVAQYVDNLLFATLVSKIFFGWTWTQVFICSLVGAIAELLCEVVFSPIGYKISKSWEIDGVGNNYLN